MDGRGVPLSLVVTGANEHDVTQLDPVLQAIMVRRDAPTTRRSKHLCADAGYRGRRALEIIESHGYIPHVVGRRTEADTKRRNPTKKARRWVVEVCHSWFNRFRKLLVRYEKLERSFLALSHSAMHRRATASHQEFSGHADSVMDAEHINIHRDAACENFGDFRLALSFS